MDWFYAKNNQQLGPVPFQVLTEMLQRGELQPGDLVWHDGMPTWIPASSAPELAQVIQNATAPVSYYNPVAASYGSMANQPPYAGFWLRFVAWIIDTILLTIVNVVLAVIFAAQGALLAPRRPQIPLVFDQIFSTRDVLAWIIGWLYFGLMESSQLQASLGKLALGLAVTDMNGQRLTFGRATGRYFGKFLSGLLTVGIGYMMAGWTRQKQALHDMIANCLVIRRR
jgi:uncharacterized RDD family membrane protein YckC